MNEERQCYWGCNYCARSNSSYVIIIKRSLQLVCTHMPLFRQIEVCIVRKRGNFINFSAILLILVLDELGLMALFSIFNTACIHYIGYHRRQLEIISGGSQCCT